MAASSSNEGRPQKLQKLDNFKRKLPYISASALSAFLQEVKESGPPELGTRKQIQEATQNALASSVYGPMILKAHAIGLDKSSKEIAFVNPLTLLAAAMEQGGGFSQMVEQTLASKTCSYEEPFRLLVYADEIVAGNPLSHHTSRKVWAFYISILEFGPIMLQKEQCWLTVMIQRSSVVNTLSAGVSQLYKILLKTIFCNEQCSVSHGMAVKLPGGMKHLFLSMGGIIQDGGAHKLTWNCKGDAGTKFCILCKNLVSHKSNIVQQDGEAILTSSMHSWNDLVLASSSDIYKSIDTLTAKKDQLNNADFKLWEQASGYNFEPEGLLFDMDLRQFLKPAQHFIHDYMHAILCNGVLATILNLCFSDLEASGMIDVYDTFHKYMKLWHLPRARNAKLSELFTAKKKKANKEANTVKASASEFLGLYPILVYFMQKTLIPAEVCAKQCVVFLELSNLLDLLQGIPVCNISPDQLATAVQNLFCNLSLAGWADSFHSKFHWMVHFSSEFAFLGCLPSCFTHERKHKAVKKFMGAITNTTGYEWSVICEVVAQDLFELKKPDTFCTTSRLENKGLASKKFKSFLEKHIAFETCYTCASLLLHPTGKVCKQDFALYKSSNGQLSCGEVWLHCEVDGQLWTLMSIYDLEVYSPTTCSAVWVHSGSQMLIASDIILCPVIWKKEQDKVTTLIPLPFRPQ